jgi:hypothetical protein
LLLWIFGGALVEPFCPKYVPVHVLLLGSVLLSQGACKWRCPLTTFEKAMLARCAPEEVYDDAFLRHYARRYFGVKIPPKRIAQALVVIFVGSVLLWGIDSLIGR